MPKLVLYFWNVRMCNNEFLCYGLKTNLEVNVDSMNICYHTCCYYKNYLNRVSLNVCLNKPNCSNKQSHKCTVRSFREVYASFKETLFLKSIYVPKDTSGKVTRGTRLVCGGFSSQRQLKCTMLQWHLKWKKSEVHCFPVLLRIYFWKHETSVTKYSLNAPF